MVQSFGFTNISKLEVEEEPDFQVLKSRASVPFWPVQDNLSWAVANVLGAGKKFLVATSLAKFSRVSLWKPRMIWMFHLFTHKGNTVLCFEEGPQKRLKIVLPSLWPLSESSSLVGGYITTLSLNKHRPSWQYLCISTTGTCLFGGCRCNPTTHTWKR